MTNQLAVINPDDFAAAVSSMLQNEVQQGCAYFKLCNDFYRNIWVIIIGWTEEGLRAKVAYQAENSIMQYDYDVDWLMPFNASGNDIWDTDMLISDHIGAKRTLEWLMAEARSMVNKGVIRLSCER